MLQSRPSLPHLDQQRPSTTSHTNSNLLPPPATMAISASPPKYSHKAQSLSDKAVKHGRRPSLSNWLRASTSGSIKSSHQSQLGSPPISINVAHISSPRFQQYAMNREGTLGSGATVVGTPQEALQDSGIVLEQEPEISQEDAYQQLPDQERYSYQSSSTHDVNEPLTSDLPSPPHSPTTAMPLSPIADEESEHESSSPSPPRPTRSIPQPPLRPSLKPPQHNVTEPSLLSAFPSVPPLPINVHPSPPQPPFAPILLSTLPNPRSTSTIDPGKIIVSLETDGGILKSTLRTLISRPSFLADYLTALFTPVKPEDDDDDASSQYSQDANSEAYHNYLTERGVVAPTSLNVHLFLDRASGPYAHILTYLRSPPTPDHPESLPRAVQLSQHSSSPHSSTLAPLINASVSTNNLESLLTLRDEARYLGLEALYSLCTEELRFRPHVRKTTHSRSSSSAAQVLMMNTHVRDNSTSSLHSNSNNNHNHNSALSSPRLEESISDKERERSWGNVHLDAMTTPGARNSHRGRRELAPTTTTSNSTSPVRDSVSTKSSASTFDSDSPTTPQSQMVDARRRPSEGQDVDFFVGELTRAGRSKSHSRATFSSGTTSPRWI